MPTPPDASPPSAGDSCPRHPEWPRVASCAECQSPVCTLCKRSRAGRTLCLSCSVSQSQSQSPALRARLGQALGLLAALLTCLLLPGVIRRGEEQALVSSVLEAERAKSSQGPDAPAPPVAPHLPAPPVDSPAPAPPLGSPSPSPAAAPALGEGAGSPPPPQPLASAGRVEFNQENVLGTSLRLVVVLPEEAPGAPYLEAALDEIQRHSKTFSRHDPESELSQLNALPWEKRRDVRISKYLARVLGWSVSWHERSGGAFAPYAGLLFRRLEKAPQGTPAAKGVGFRVARKGKRTYSLTCERDGAFDLDAIAKGFIVDRALRAVMRTKPTPRGALVDIGGEIALAGSAERDRDAPWPIEVADPRRPAENSPPLAQLALRGLCVASSGNYGRARGRKHLIDPRRGAPARGVLGATVVAPDTASADVLATILCILPPRESLTLVESLPGVAALVLDSEERVWRSRRWRALSAGPSKRPGPAELRWPADYVLEVEFTLRESRPTGEKRRKFKRHGTAVWIEDQAGRRVRLLALWHDRGELKYLRKLPAFWWDGWVLSGGPNDPRALKNTTRATRAPGHYRLEWDGRDDSGQHVPQGRYRVRIDINRENGPPRGREEHTEAALEIECGASEATGHSPDQPELADVSASYRQRP